MGLPPHDRALRLRGHRHGLWDLCGKACGQPLYRLFGGALREEVDYFYYLAQGSPEEIARQGADGVERGYTCFYLKVGLDSAAEAQMLAALRRAIGPERKIRIDANMAWCVPQAVKLLTVWDAAYDLDFCEAPVRAEPVAAMQEVRARVPVALCVNEGLGRPVDVLHQTPQPHRRRACASARTGWARCSAS